MSFGSKLYATVSCCRAHLTPSIFLFIFLHRYGNKDYSYEIWVTDEPTWYETAVPSNSMTEPPIEGSPEQEAAMSSATAAPSTVDSMTTGLTPTSVPSYFRGSSTTAESSIPLDALPTVYPSLDSSFERKLEWVTTQVPYDASTDAFATSYYLSLALGCIVLTIQIIDMLLVLAPRFLCKFPIMQELFVPSCPKAEANQQKAAFHKTSQMLRSALYIHTEGNNKIQKSSKMRDSRSSQTKAILSYQQHEVERVTEEVGGPWWTWTRILNGSLAREDGVWIHSRLLACTIAQLIIVSCFLTSMPSTAVVTSIKSFELMINLSFVDQMISICFMATLGYKNAYQFVYSTNASIDVQANEILESRLNQSYACLNTEFMKITGVANSSSVVGVAGAVASASLLQPLSLDQMMAYEEYWNPGDDAHLIQQVLYAFTMESINGCLGLYGVSFQSCANACDE